jgi:hypothetical protein
LDLVGAVAARAVEPTHARSPQPQNSRGNISETPDATIARYRPNAVVGRFRAGNWHHVIPAERNYNEEACSA